MPNCCCTKPDPERTCGYCFSGQTWTTDFSGSDLRLFENYFDNIFDVADDVAKCAASYGMPTGLLPNQSGSGFNSHAYVQTDHAWRFGLLADSNIANSFTGSDQSQVVTESGNSFNYTPPTQFSPDDSTRIYLTQIVSGKAHPIKVIGINENMLFEVEQIPIHFVGYYQFPHSALLANTFERTYRATFNLQTIGNDLTEFASHAGNTFAGNSGFGIANFRITELAESMFWPFGEVLVACQLGEPYTTETPFPIENGDDITTVAGPLDDRPVLIGFRVSGGAGVYTVFNTGGSFSDVKDSAFSVVLTVEQTTAAINRPGLVDSFSVGYQITLAIPELSFSETITGLTGYFNRCNFGVVVALGYQPQTMTARRAERSSRFYNPGKRFIVSDTIAASWVPEINATAAGVQDEQVFINSSISDFRLTDSQTVAAGFRCIRAEQIRSGAVVASLLASEFSAASIPHDTTWEVSANVGDSFKVYFDNLGAIATEITDVDFDTTNGLITAVDRTTEVFEFFEVNHFDFTGPTGAVAINTINRLEFTHDQTGNIITSPFFLNIKAKTGIIPPPP